MSDMLKRRAFLQRAALSAGALAGAALLPEWTLAEDKPQAKGAFPPLTLIAGKPRERGRMYGSRFKEGIQTFLEREAWLSRGPSHGVNWKRFAFDDTRS